MSHYARPTRLRSTQQYRFSRVHFPLWHYTCSISHSYVTTPNFLTTNILPLLTGKKIVSVLFRCRSIGVGDLPKKQRIRESCNIMVYIQQSRLEEAREKEVRSLQGRAVTQSLTQFTRPQSLPLRSLAHSVTLRPRAPARLRSLARSATLRPRAPARARCCSRCPCCMATALNTKEVITRDRPSSVAHHPPHPHRLSLIHI